jgi:hypothetical protein
MTEEKLVELERPQRRSVARGVPDTLKRADLTDIMASETLVLATAIAQAILNGLEMKERRKERRLLLIIACGLAGLIGLVRLVMMQLLRS